MIQCTCKRNSLFGESLDLAAEARDLARSGVLVEHALAGGAHHFRFGGFQGCTGRISITGADRLFYPAQKSPHTGSSGYIDPGTAGDLPDGAFGGCGVGHFNFHIVVQSGGV